MSRLMGSIPADTIVDAAVIATLCEYKRVRLYLSESMESVTDQCEVGVKERAPQI